MVLETLASSGPILVNRGGGGDAGGPERQVKGNHLNPPQKHIPWKLESTKEFVTTPPAKTTALKMAGAISGKCKGYGPQLSLATIWDLPET